MILAFDSKAFVKAPGVCACVCVPAASLGQSAILQIEIRLTEAGAGLRDKAGLVLCLGDVGTVAVGAIACLRVYAPLLPADVCHL